MKLIKPPRSGTTNASARRILTAYNLTAERKVDSIVVGLVMISHVEGFEMPLLAEDHMTPELRIGHRSGDCRQAVMTQSVLFYDCSTLR